MSSPQSGKTSFEIAIHKIITFLEKEKIPYFVLGGLAVGVMGEPRFTRDIDLDLFLEDDEIGILLKRLKKASFRFNAKEAITSAMHFGTFRLFYKTVQIDMVLS